MKQARTLQDVELRTVLKRVLARRYAARDRAVLALSYYAGLRAHEIAWLALRDVVGQDGTVLREVALSAAQTKGRQARTIFISERLRRELAAYLESRPGKQPEDPLFRTQKGNAFTPNAMAHLFKAIYADCGIAGASSHSGRRTFITNLAAKGVSVRVLAALAGHASIGTTQRYIDVNDNQLRAAVELF